MSLIIPAELLQHVETDLSTTALQRIIDGQEKAITKRFGEHEAQTQVFYPNYSNVIYPTRRVSSITAIVERDGNTDTTLSADDYEITNSIRIDRLPDGTNSRTYWAPRVHVTYVPEDEAALRIQVLIDLCRLTIAYNALKRESTGDYSAESKDYQKERLEIMSQLGGRGLA
ncbi:MAG: hypothetical protein D4R45_06990 [Planctomycetaceae bacterium]|nr:MAG: hypothetical protein D4R45_06990 [Planctomycetaceae bacterium]